MTLLETTRASIVPADLHCARAAQEQLDRKTKPRGSLGMLETLACRLAAIYRNVSPVSPARAVVVMAGDHGVAEEGVSAYPQEVTAQMVRNFASGGAAINVLARHAGARVVVVDMGTRTSPGVLSGVQDRRLGPGTANFSKDPAMSRECAMRALEVGIETATSLIDEGIGLIGVGDMGIANTTASSAIIAALTGAKPARVTGRGTGIGDDRLNLKRTIIERALALHRPDPKDPLDVLAKLGGFEIVGLTGVILGAAARRVPVVLDGFITGASALAAVRLCPAVLDYLVVSHRSVEPGHEIILQELGLRPLFDLEMRLGEGTGAVLAMHLIEAALRILNEMATFETAGVTDAGA